MSDELKGFLGCLLIIGLIALPTIWSAATHSPREPQCYDKAVHAMTTCGGYDADDLGAANETGR